MTCPLALAAAPISAPGQGGAAMRYRAARNPARLSPDAPRRTGRAGGFRRADR